MRRTWFVVIVSLVVVVAIVLVARFDEDHDATGKGYDIKCTQPNEPSSATTSLTCVANPEKNTDQSKGNPPQWHKLVAWPEGITAWLLLITLGAIIWQAWETRKAARAALLNAQAVINTERAWLVVNIKKDNPIPFPAENFINVLNNLGHTPAIVRSIHIQWEFSSFPDGLPVPPVYKAMVNIPEHMFVVGPDDLRIGIPMDPQKITFRESKRERDEPEFLVWYGRIVYEDVFGANGAATPKLHETRWCYAWIEGEKRFAPCGPEEYNRKT